MTEKIPTELKIRYRGKLIGGKWCYTAPRVVELPVPFISRSEKEGEVLCNPSGIFPYKDGKTLLEMSGQNGPFILEEQIFGEPVEPAGIEQEIAYTRTAIVDNPNPPPPFQPKSPEAIHKAINRARLKRGKRIRKERSDKGISRPFGAKKASLPDNPQVDAVELAPSPA